MILLSGTSAEPTFDNFKTGYDNNADNDIDDAGDDVQVDDDFSSTTITITRDNNGNVTDDGVYKYVYVAWNPGRAASGKGASRSGGNSAINRSSRLRRMPLRLKNRSPCLA